jgi:hypothetical protein
MPALEIEEITTTEALEQLRLEWSMLWARGWQEGVSAQDACPMLILPATVEELPGIVPHRLLRNLRYDWRRAEKCAPVRVENAAESSLNKQQNTSSAQ